MKLESYIEVTFTEEELDALLEKLVDTEASYTPLGIAKSKLIQAQIEIDESS